MGLILTRVISTTDKGLIGFTEDGKKVALSAPKPSSCPKSDKEVTVKTSSNELYFHFEKESPYVPEGINFINYNLYTKRK